MRRIAIGAVAVVGLLGRGAAAPEEPRKLGTFGAGVQVAFSPDGARLAATTRGGSAVLVDVESGERTARFSGKATPEEQAPAAPPPGEGTDLPPPSTEPAEPEQPIPEAAPSESALALSRDGARLALGTLEGQVLVFDARSGALKLTIEAQGAVRSLAFSADGAALVTGGGLPDDPETGEPAAAAPTARVFDAASGAQLLAVDAESKNTASAVAASPAGPIVAVARADGKLLLLNLAEKKRHTVELGGPSLAVAFSRDGALVVASGGADGAAATLLDVASGKVLRGLARGNDPAAAEGALAFSPDGKHIARAPFQGGPGTRRLFLHSVETGKILRAVDLPGACASLAWAPDGATLAVGLRSGDVLLVRNPLTP